MFGVTALMINHTMAVAVHNDGSLLVRVDPVQDGSLRDNPYASQAEMGTGRSMGKSWIRVDTQGLRTKAALDEWIHAAVRYLDRLKPATSPAPPTPVHPNDPNTPAHASQ
jgi:TfoX/Sxy family transcriptional regulator of competence genes